VIVIVFGVSGAGKTTVGKLLAEELGWRFYEADDFHSPGNVEKMRRGIPLTDEDRWPGWRICAN
jgi:gluconokinase